MVRINGVLFDKDGTLFDFHATWSRWSAALIAKLADGSAAKAADLEIGRASCRERVSVLV